MTRQEHIGWGAKRPIAEREIHQKERMVMRANHLRIYCEPPENTASAGVAEAKETRETVTVPLTTVLPLLEDAAVSKRTWLRDFEDDEITISMDLYEVILAYQHYRRPSA